MAITIELPRALQAFARGRSIIELDGPCATVRDVLAAVGASWPGVVDRVMTERGEVREHVNVFVDEESIRFHGGLDAPVTDQSTIIIVPAVSGG